MSEILLARIQNSFGRMSVTDGRMSMFLVEQTDRRTDGQTECIAQYGFLVGGSYKL